MNLDWSTSMHHAISCISASKLIRRCSSKLIILSGKYFGSSSLGTAELHNPTEATHSNLGAIQERPNFLVLRTTLAPSDKSPATQMQRLAIEGGSMHVPTNSMLVFSFKREARPRCKTTWCWRMFGALEENT
ncbi:hypothetical protein QQP08_010636 [Theobroma cacao]|nr:hypothetical protein QQP08_010636 [Theobroma cacao]